MWLFTKTGFYSVVAKHGDTDILTVRARVEEDLFALQKILRTLAVHPLQPIHKTPERDYPFRMFMTRPDFLVLMTSMAYCACTVCVQTVQHEEDANFVTKMDISGIFEHGTVKVHIPHETRDFVQKLLSAKDECDTCGYVVCMCYQQ